MEGRTSAGEMEGANLFGRRLEGADLSFGRRHEGADLTPGAHMEGRTSAGRRIRPVHEGNEGHI